MGTITVHFCLICIDIIIVIIIIITISVIEALQLLQLVPPCIRLETIHQKGRSDDIDGGHQEGCLRFRSHRHWRMPVNVSQIRISSSQR